MQNCTKEPLKAKPVRLMFIVQPLICASTLLHQILKALYSIFSKGGK